VTTQDSAAHYDKVISTIYSRDLANLCPPNSLPSLASSTAVDIQVVNLWYPNPNQNPFRGFGYLIPNSVPMAPVDQNPENALGVLFDSDRESILPSAARPHAERNRSGCEGDTLPGTKLTVMLGGHHWAGMPQFLLPDAQEGARLARSVVQRSLGIPADAKVFASAKMARNAIPQHTVGHFSRMRAADRELQTAFRGRLAVAGTSYTAQGVLPALRAGRDVARTTALRPSIAVVRFTSEGPAARSPELRGSTFPDDVGDTGLARFRNDVAAWTATPKKSNVFMREIEPPMFSSNDNSRQ
jgi:protoporphyrinogen/coproporphyrinogen III oxidase